MVVQENTNLKSNKDNTEKRMRYLTLLVLLSLYLSLLETFIPKPFPWLKFGLANIATIIALEKFDNKMPLEIIFLRVFIQSIMLGTLFSPGFIISIISGGISTLVTIFIYRYRKYLSLVSICVAGGFTHNLIQLIVVYFLLFRNIDIFNKSIFVFIFLFLFMGCISGVITGVICTKLKLNRRRKI